MSTAEKMIPKAVLLRALHEIMDMARHPEEYASKAIGAPIARDVAFPYALGFIEASARSALGADAPTAGWLAQQVKP